MKDLLMKIWNGDTDDMILGILLIASLLSLMIYYFKSKFEEKL